MSFGPKEILFAVVLGAGGLGLKVAIEDPVNYDNYKKPILSAVETSLRNANFQAITQVNARTLVATRDNCVLAIGVSRPEGGADAAFESAFSSIGRVRFWYRGEVLNERPGARAIIDRYLNRLKIIVGVRPSLHPVYHFAVAPTCRLEDIKSLDIDRIPM